MAYHFRNRNRNVSYVETSDDENDFCMMVENLRTPVAAPQINDHGNGGRRGRGRGRRPNRDAGIREDSVPRWENRRARRSNSRRSRTVLDTLQINDRSYVPETSPSLEQMEIDNSSLNETSYVPESNNTREQSLMMKTGPSSINGTRNAGVPQMGNDREQNMMMETHSPFMNDDGSSFMNASNNIPENNNNQEQNAMMEANPSAINERAGVPEMSHIQEHNVMMEPDPSSVPEPLPRSTSGTSLPHQQSVHFKKTILTWLTACKAVGEGGQVRYEGGVKKITGRISNGGIICSCCDEEFSVWDFEKHNKSTQQQPYKKIFVIGRNCPLEQCIIGVWMSAEEQKRRSVFSYVPNKEEQTHDSCLVCGDGVEGEFIFCDKCPSTYHKSCANMQNVRFFEYWLCHYCRCKYCEVGEESEHLVTCCQCLKKFHWRCVEDSEKDELMQAPLLQCSRNCKEIYERLERLVGIQNQIPDKENFSWSVVRQMDAIHEDRYVNINSKVAVACMLMNEAFGTIRDARIGNDLVQSVMYNRGSNLRRLNFSRFYTFVMEKGDSIIAAAPIRFHGKDIAEMPFFATDEAYRGKGFCRLFMGLIEHFLLSVKVKELILSSTQETLELWKEKCNFDVITDRGLKRKVSSCNMLTLPRSIKLHKGIYKVQDLNMEQVPEE